MLVIQIMEALWLLMHIIISARFRRLITTPTMIIWRNMAIVTKIFLRLRRLALHFQIRLLPQHLRLLELLV